jgi:uncharacterized protein
MDTSKPATGFQVVFLASTVVLFAAISSAPIAKAIGWPTEHEEQFGRMLAIFAGAAIFLAVAPLRRFCISQLSVALPHSALPEIGLVTAAKLLIPFGVAGAFVLWAFNVDGLFNYRKALFLHESASALATIMPLWMTIAFFSVSWVTGPIVEELLFRGFLFRAWERQFGWMAAMTLTSIVFGLCHPGNFWSCFLGGIIYVCVLRRTRSLWGPILVHGAHNMLVSVPGYLELLLVKPRSESVLLANWTFEISCLAFVILALPTYLWLARNPSPSPVPSTHVPT